MLRWAPYPFIRITLSFIAGILLYFIMGRDFRYTTEVLAFFVALYFVAYLLSRKYKSAGITDTAGILGLLCFVAGGLWVTHQHTAAHDPSHLLHLSSQPTYYVGVVDDYVVQKPGYQSTVLQVQQVQVNGAWQPAGGKVQLSVPHDSEQNYELMYGDVLLIKGAPQPVAPPANPGQFDYKAYLANKNIYYRHYLRPFQYQKIGHHAPWAILYYSIQLRRKLDNLLRERVTEKREYGIAAALILGVKDELDNDVRQAYANTGTMHVLAVSGLHVGLIYALLMLLLSRFNFSGRLRLLQVVVVLLMLWGYAFVTGLSPSVVRAVLMFSLVAVGLGIRRRTNIYNTIAIAAAVLLLINPYNLLEVSFQLSFLAVLGIVYLQPKFYNLLEINNWFLDKVWALFTVAVAAQLATLPLGLYYFHQFPVYFWLTNIVVVPLATLVLYTGVVALALSWVPLLSGLLFQVHLVLTFIMNDFNLWVQRWPQALINGIDITAFQMSLLYTLLVLFILFLALKKLRYLALATVVVAILSGLAIGEVMQQKEQQKLAIYNVRGATGVAMVEGLKAVLMADSALLHNKSNYTFNIQPHLWQLGVAQPQFISLTGRMPVSDTIAMRAVLPDSNSLVVWQGQRMLILSHTPQFQPKAPLAVNYILLRNNVRLKPADLQTYTSEKVILDASNAPWYRQRLHQQLDMLSIPYYDVVDSGAFVVDLK